MIREEQFINAIKNKDIQAIRLYLFDIYFENKIYDIEICDNMIKDIFPSLYKPMTEYERIYFEDDAFDRMVANGDIDLEE